MSSNLETLADRVASRNGIPTDIFRNLISRESSWNPSATGKAGEIGLVQIKPSSAMEVGIADIYSPPSNLEAGARYLTAQFQRFGNWRDALSAYNAGASNIQAGRGYADAILGDATPVAAEEGFGGTVKRIWDWSPLSVIPKIFTFGGSAATGVPVDESGMIDGSEGRSFLASSGFGRYVPVAVLALVAILLIVAGGWTTVTQSARGARKFAGA